MIREFKGEYSWLSNFSECLIVLDGFSYASVEHAYMSAKCDSDDWRIFCMSTKHAGAVKKASKKINLRNDWDSIKLKVMAECLVQKYRQEPYRTLLLNTNDAEIIEGNWWNDRYWGICLKTNSGENMLGKLIMSIRKNLAAQTVNKNVNNLIK